MNLEYFPDAGVRGELVLLHSGNSEEVARLREALRGLADGRRKRLPIHELPFVHSVDGCRLTAVRGASDVGVLVVAAGFEWTLDPEGWLQVEELLEPFGEEAPGEHFQHLNPARGPEVLYSSSGSW